MQQSIEIKRGAHNESAHRVSISIRRDDGASLLAWGSADAQIFPRSSIKIVQALPLLLSGAVEAYDLDGRMLALACASHTGEHEHVSVVADMLARAGLNADDLECGTHWPVRSKAAYDLAAARQKPSSLHNACSGKHAGFLLACKQHGYDTKNYTHYDHPIQNDIRNLFETLTGLVLTQQDAATDGCAIPSYVMPLDTLALLFAKISTGACEAAAYADAFTTLREACAAYPFYVCGTGRFDTKVMQALGTRAFVKMGAEGVYVGMLPELKSGFALKCEDGAGRAAECVVANIIAALLPLDDAEKQLIAPLCAPVLHNWNGTEVGSVSLSSDLKQALTAL